MGSDATQPDLDGLAAEILALSRRGLRSTTPPESPILRDLLGIPDSLPGDQALPMIRASIIEAAHVLPPDHRQVFLESSGARAGSPFGRERRLKAAARVGNVSERTARRWSEELAPRQLAAHLLSNTRRVVLNSSFAVTHLHAWLDLSKDRPTLALQRSIRVLAPRMEKFHEEVFLPDLQEGLPTWRGLQGCELDQVADLGHGMWGTSFKFDRPLMVGDTHNFSTSIKIPNRASLRPELGFRPHNTTLNAVVDIQFGQRRPARIETFQTTAIFGLVPESHVTSVTAPCQRQERFEFEEIQLGFGLGVRWFMDD